MPPEQCRAAAFTLGGGEAHHALRVLRVREGERVMMLDGRGQELHCAVTGQKRDTLSLQIIERKTIPPPPCAITLLQAVPKGKIFESVIQKATELGTVRDLEKYGVADDRIYVSMERNMKCGVGFCGHCQFGPTFVCKDGPVFRYDLLAPLLRVREL